jgi:hypothetical protein
MERSGEQDRRESRWEPPPDSDLIGIPLVLGAGVALLAILAAFFFLGWVGFIVLGVVLVVALAISYRVIAGSESQD